MMVEATLWEHAVVSVLYIFAAEYVLTILTGHLSEREPRNQKKKWEEERKNKRNEGRHG